MPSYADPSTLHGQPLMLRRLAVDDYVVIVAGLRCGRILGGTGPGMSTVWTWTVTGPYVPPHLQPSNGRAATLGEAKAAFRATFENWLVWAQEQRQPAAWHG